MSESDTSPVTLFYSYAHKDEVLRDELAGHLKILERKGWIRPWHDRMIVAGEPWDDSITAALDSAELVLLLVSSHFIASDYIFGNELKRAMDRHAQKACDVVFIVVSAVDIGPDDEPFKTLQGLPTDLKPVTSWSNRDEAWTNVAKGLRARVALIRERRPARPALPRMRSASPLEAVLPRATDAVLDTVVAGVVQQIDVAERARSNQPVMGALRQQMAQETRALIDAPDAPRVLWVDDQPDNNRGEMAVLAKLQIEVVAVRSTAEAMDRIAEDARVGERFDLVLTDWSRPKDRGPAALSLIESLRAADHNMPVVVYHGEFQPASRAKRAAQCVAAGALGEAVLPTELMALVTRALTVGG